MDTLFLTVNGSLTNIQELLSTILCSITTFNKKSILNANEINDDATNKSNISYASEASESTLVSVSTFPSLYMLRSYQSQWTDNLTNELSIITQLKSTSTINPSQEYPFSYTSQSQNISPPTSPASSKSTSDSPPEKIRRTGDVGGKRKYKTKKHKKHTKKSKLSKKNKHIRRNSKSKKRKNNHTKK